VKKAFPIPVILLVLFLLLPVTGCSQQQVTIESGKLLMMGNENIAFLEIANGRPTGFSADLATAIAEHLGLKLEVTLEPFSGLFSRLKAGRSDIVMSAVTITPERKAEMDFSQSYFSSGQALLVPLGSKITNESDLKGKTVGVLKDSTNQKEAEKIQGIKEIVKFDTKPPIFDALLAGRLDAVICDTPFAQFNAKKTGKTRIAKVLTRGDRYGIALKKGNTRLLGRINNALTNIKHDGMYDRLYNKYFGAKI